MLLQHLKMVGYIGRERGGGRGREETRRGEERRLGEERRDIH